MEKLHIPIKKGCKDGLLAGLMQNNFLLWYTLVRQPIITGLVLSAFNFSMLLALPNTGIANVVVNFMILAVYLDLWSQWLC